MNAGVKYPVGLEDLLRFYAEAGVDAALEDAPVDRFAEEAAARQAVEARASASGAQEKSRQVETARPGRFAATLSPGAREPAVQPVTTQAPAAIPDEAQAARARQLAREAKSLDELRAMLDAFDGCNLKYTAKQLVFSDGNPLADLMLVGEAPGREEDIEGRPFVGRSGQLLDRILAAIGRDRSSAYIANVVPWRPPGNRDPSPFESEICRPFIERQIELVNPKVLVTLGNPSTKLLLNTQTGIMRMRGKWSTFATPAGAPIPAMPTLHPAYLLRNPGHKKLVWRDFLEVKARLAQP